MKKLELTTLGVKEISREESLSCKGGSCEESLWYRLGWTAAKVLQGLNEFGKEGGRNAGLCVK